MMYCYTCTHTQRKTYTVIANQMKFIAKVHLASTLLEMVLAVRLQNMRIMNQMRFIESKQM